MRIVSAASAFPKYVYDQRSVAQALKAFWSGRPNAELVERIHSRCGVSRRHFVLPLEAYERIQTWGQANDLWIENAQHLGMTAICRAITPVGLSAREIDALYFTSVTGIASPSVDALLVNLMGLSPHIKRIPIFGLGCVAGAAGIARAADYIRSFPEQVAVVLAVELCSLTWQRDDLSLANVISAGLFGDGAAAVVLAGSNSALEGPEIVSTRSTFYPGTKDAMGWDISEKGFEIVLSPDVPNIIERHLRSDVDTFLGQHGLARADIASWIIHSGGPKILQAVENALELKPDDLKLSWESLDKLGNLSSASVLTVLEQALKWRRCATGRYSLLAAMGPGFCSELVLLRW